MAYFTARNLCAHVTLAAMLTTAAPLAADNVTLRSIDGDVEISGDFISFEDNTYVVQTALGRLSFPADAVRCDGTACPEFDVAETDVSFVGSGIIGTTVMPLILQGYAGFRDGDANMAPTGRAGEYIATLTDDGGFGDDFASFRVDPTVSGDAFTALLRPGQQIGMSSRRITPNEIIALEEAGAGNMTAGNQEFIFAIDSIVVITHPENPLRSISIADLERIYTGAVTNWSQLGGLDQPITVVDRPSTDGTRDVFIDRILPDGATVTSNAVIASGNTAVANTVNSDLGAISYTGYAFQRGAKPLSLINECGLSMSADAFSARTEEYAFQRRLYLYKRADANAPQITDFIDFIRSENADPIISKAGFIDLGVDRRGQSPDSERAAQIFSSNFAPSEAPLARQMLRTMEQFDRLSTTFRFATGSSELDERALTDMARLTDYLLEQPADTRVLIVGFTDDVGGFELNRRLAEGRAIQVRRQLFNFADGRLNGRDVGVAAYGEVAPAACNISEAGRSINRRVEVWIETAR